MNEEETPTQNQNTGQPIPRIRTYRADVAESLQKEKQSLARMVIAEKLRKERGETVETFPEETKRGRIIKITAISAGVLLLAATLAIGIFLFLQNKITEEAPPPVLPNAWSPIFTEKSIETPLERLHQDEFRFVTQNIRKTAAIPLNGVLHIIFTQQENTPSGTQKKLVSGRELVSSLSSDVPNELTRTLGENIFFGLYALRSTEPFLILQNSFYDGAFLGMLRWEKFIANDLASFFGGVAASGQTFEDRVIRNIDTRVLSDLEGAPFLIYAFIDRDTILITKNEETFTEVVTRLKTPSPIVR